MSLNFSSHTCILQDVKHLKMIGRGDLHVGLYVFDTIDFNSQLVSRTCCFDDVSTHMAHVVRKHTWHNRFGYISFPKLEMMKNLLSYKNNEDVSYSICPLAK